MLIYITEKEYKELLGKNSIPNNFHQLTIEASNDIHYRTFGRIDQNKIPEQVKYVTCLMIDLLEEQETKLSEIGNLKSQNIEGWSESYATPEEIKTDYDKKIQIILSKYLWNIIGNDGKPLLYCGVN